MLPWVSRNIYGNSRLTDPQLAAHFVEVLTRCDLEKLPSLVQAPSRLFVFPSPPLPTQIRLGFKPAIVDLSAFLVDLPFVADVANHLTKRGRIFGIKISHPRISQANDWWQQDPLPLLTACNTSQYLMDLTLSEINLGTSFIMRVGNDSSWWLLFSKQVIMASCEYLMHWAQTLRWPHWMWAWTSTFQMWCNHLPLLPACLFKIGKWLP